MNKNGCQIYTNKIIDEKAHAKPAQVGVDLSVAKIETIKGNNIYFDENSKVHNIEYEEAPFDIEDGVKIYHLYANTNYAVEFEQGLRKLDSNEWGLMIQRSSLLRAGCHLVSSIWDPGFETSTMGSTLFTGNVGLDIPVGTRVAQILIFDNEPVEEENLYNGRWQKIANH